MINRRSLIHDFFYISIILKYFVRIKTMEIKIIAEASRKIDRFFKNWGLSVLIGEEILFDTFSNSRILKKNLVKLNVDVNKLKYVIISHEHWDHIGGLWWLLGNYKGLTVVVCKNFSQDFKDKIKSFDANLLEIDHNPQLLAPSIYSSGELKCEYKNDFIYEQTIVLEDKIRKKCTIITGCAHPGIIQIVEKIKKDFNYQIELLLGGFHLKDMKVYNIQQITDQLKDDFAVEQIAPCHCTGKKANALFKKKFSDKYITIKTGSQIMS